MSLTLAQFKKEFQKLADPTKAKSSAWFFKTEPGQYGHGDKFLGLTVPQQRRLAKQYRDLSLAEVLKLLQSPFHEHRLTAAIILVDQFRRGDKAEQKKIVAAYLHYRRFINNWDIVDTSAPHILGAWLFDKSRQPLYRLAHSQSLWDRRIAILATQYFIRHNDFSDTLKLAKVLLADREDLIHKAVGWMLREVGQRQIGLLRHFLNLHAPTMPRTMLRYAIEKLPAAERQRYVGTG